MTNEEYIDRQKQLKNELLTEYEILLTKINNNLWGKNQQDYIFFNYYFGNI